jgi:hypothetical protein
MATVTVLAFKRGACVLTHATPGSFDTSAQTPLGPIESYMYSRKVGEPGVCRHRSCEAIVSGEQRAIKSLSQSDIRGVICGEVPIQLQHSREECLVPMASQRKIEIINGCISHSVERGQTSEQNSAQPRGKFHIAESGNVNIVGKIGHEHTNRLRPFGTEHVFEESRGVGDNNRQETSRLRRSSLSSSATGRLKFTEERDPIRSNTSSAGGLASSRSSMAWM